jgi:hypothetical protein
MLLDWSVSGEEPLMSFKIFPLLLWLLKMKSEMLPNQTDIRLANVPYG